MSNSLTPSTIKRVHSYFITFILMFCLSATTVSSKTAFAYLDVTFHQLFFDYGDDSTIKSYQNDNRYRVWKGSEITDTEGNPGWTTYSNLINTVVFTSAFSEVKPHSLAHWFDGLTELTYLQNMSNLNTSEASLMEYMFQNCSSLKEIDASKFNTSNVLSFAYMCKGCKSLTKLNISSFDTSKAITMWGMFMQCEKLASLNLYNFNTQNVTTMNEMFRECKSLTSLNLLSFRTLKVDAMRYMFCECNELSSLDLSSFNTSNVKYMDGMFYMCMKLESLDLSHFNTSKVTNMSLMFNNCISLKELNIDGFNTANVTTMNGMFQGCATLRRLNMASFNTANVTDMQAMFNACTKLQVIDVSNFDVSKVKTMDYMFYSCLSLRTIICSNTWSTNSSTSMFGGSPNLVGAIPFQDSNTSVAFANPNTGYFTRLKPYNLWVCGTQVSNANDFDLCQIKGVEVYDNGYATFDSQSNTLKLKNVSISAYDDCAIRSQINGLTIQVDDNGREEEFGSAVIHSALSKGKSNATLFFQNNTTITGDGGMTVMSMPQTYDAESSIAIRAEKNLVFNNAKVAAAGSNAIHGMLKGSITVKGKQTYLQFIGSNGDVVCLTNITFEDGNRVLGNTCYGIYRNDTYGYYIGDLCTSMAPVIKSNIDTPLTIGLGYGIYVNGVQVTSSNCNKLSKIYGVSLGDMGDFRYDPANKILYMKQVMISSQKDTIPLVLWEPDMKVEVQEGAILGTNILIADKAKYALQISHRTTIKSNKNLVLKGDGILYAVGGTESAIGIDNQARLTLDNASIFAYGSAKGITGYGSNTTMDIGGISIVKAHSDDICLSGISRINFNKSVIIEPSGAEYAYDPSRTLQCIRLNGEPVKGKIVTIVYNPFDVNADGYVDISDIVAVINTIAGNNTYLSRADVNMDGGIDISDIVAIINFIAGK